MVGGADMPNASSDVGVAKIEAGDEVGGERRWGSNGSGWVGAAEEVRVDPGAFPPGGRAVVLVREPSFVPAVNAVFFSVGESPTRCGGFGDGTHNAGNNLLGVILQW